MLLYIECAGLIACCGDRGVMGRYWDYGYGIDNNVSSGYIL